MRLKEYGFYSIVLSHSGNIVTKDLYIYFPQDLKKLGGSAAYAGINIKHGEVIDSYGTISHVLDVNQKSIDWNKI